MVVLFPTKEKDSSPHAHRCLWLLVERGLGGKRVADRIPAGDYTEDRLGIEAAVVSFVPDPPLNSPCPRIPPSSSEEDPLGQAWLVAQTYNPSTAVEVRKDQKLGLNTGYIDRSCLENTKQNKIPK